MKLPVPFVWFLRHRAELLDPEVAHQKVKSDATLHRIDRVLGEIHRVEDLAGQRRAPR